MEGSKFLTIDNTGCILDEQGYNHTKVLGLKCGVGTEQKLIRTQPKTWASLLREVIHTFEFEINECVAMNSNKFEILFNASLQETINENNIKTNTSFSEVLFTNPTHIRSNVYRNNQNSMCKIFEDPHTGENKYITAVYSGEVVWVLDALMKTLQTKYDTWVEIEYIHREELKRQLDNLDNEDRQLSIDDIELDEEEDTIELQSTLLLETKIIETKIKDLMIKAKDTDVITALADIILHVYKVQSEASDVDMRCNIINEHIKEISNKLGF